MQTTFTQHALVRMAERGISQAEILATLAQPLLSFHALLLPIGALVIQGLEESTPNGENPCPPIN